MEKIEKKSIFYKTFDNNEFTSKRIAQLHEDNLMSLLKSDVYILKYIKDDIKYTELIAANDIILIERYLDNKNITRTIYKNNYFIKNDEYIKITNHIISYEPTFIDYLTYITSIKEALLNSSIIVKDIILLDNLGYSKPLNINVN